MVRGLDIFISTIRSHTELKENSIKLIKRFIIDSGCPSIKFENLSTRAAGISKTDECIISTIIFGIPVEYFVYIMLHEVAHQFQYLKHGKNIALSIYQNTEINEAANKLLSLEKVADRLAIKKAREVLRLSNIHTVDKIIPRYLNLTDTSQIKSHILDIRAQVELHGLTTIEQINNCIYNKISVNGSA